MIFKPFSIDHGSHVAVYNGLGHRLTVAIVDVTTRIPNHTANRMTSPMNAADEAYGR